MKLSTAKKNVELLTKMWDLVMELDGMPTGHLEDAINEGLADMKTQLRWSVVYHLTENKVVDLGAVRVDLSSGIVIRPDGETELTAKEFQLFSKLPNPI